MSASLTDEGRKAQVDVGVGGTLENRRALAESRARTAAARVTRLTHEREKLAFESPSRSFIELERRRLRLAEVERQLAAEKAALAAANLELERYGVSPIEP